MSQQSPKLQDLKEHAAALLTFDLCQQYDPAHNLREECREIEERWEKLKERLQLALQEVKEKVSIVQCSLVPRPHPLTRRNGLVNQVEFLGLAHAFATT